MIYKFIVKKRVVTTSEIANKFEKISKKTSPRLREKIDKHVDVEEGLD